MAGGSAGAVTGTAPPGVGFELYYMLRREGHGSRSGRRRRCREGDRATGKAEAQPSVQSTAKLPEGQGRLCSRWPPLNTSSRNSPKALLAEGLTALPGWESQVDEALTGCSCP